jgi:predicted MPP superfamily phosphohydrolase
VSAGGPLARTYARGRFELPDNGPLMVSRGVGCSNIPLRLNADPELTLCALMPSTLARPYTAASGARVSTGRYAY